MLLTISRMKFIDDNRMSKRQTRVGDPQVYKKLIKQLADSHLYISKVDVEMDRLVGKTANDARWKLMKRKYSLLSATNSSRRNSGL